MTPRSSQFQKMWQEQCAATARLRKRFGLDIAIDYLIRDKFFTFVHYAENHAKATADLPAFITEIHGLFTKQELSQYLDHLKRTKRFRGEERLRFLRMRQLLEQ